METARFEIDGMTCGHCVARVNKTLTAMNGVTVEDVQVGSAVVAFDPQATSIDKIRAAIDDAGYDSREVAPS